MSDSVVLVPHDPGWPDAYRVARDEILSCLPLVPRLIEHMGSTAVPGLPAKPIIDIIVLVNDIALARQAIPALEAAGYEYRPEVSGPNRIFLRRKRAQDGQRTHHLHLHDSEDDVQRHLLFRDRLRADEVVRGRYLALKRDLAARFTNDREAYSKGKDAFVDEVIMSVGDPPRQPFWNP